MAPNNPAKLATNNPKAFSLTNTQLAGNSRLGVNNVTSFPNITNPKSLGQPSANGFTDLPNNPKYTPYRGSTTPAPIVNETQAVTTTASEVSSGFKAIGKGLGVLSLLAIPSVVQDFSQAVGFLANLPQISKNYSEKERLDALIKARENQAKASLNARIDTPAPQVITATVWRVSGSGLDCNGGGIYPNSQYDADIIQLSNQPAPQLVDSPHPSCGQYNTKNIQYPDGTTFAIHLHPSATLTISHQNTVPFVFPSSGVNTAPPANEWIYGEVPVTVSGNAAAILDDIEAKAKSSFPKITTKPNSGSPDPKNDVKTANPAIKPVSSPNTSSPTSSPGFPTVAPSVTTKTVNDTSGFKSVGATQTSASQTYANGQTNETYANARQTAPSVTTKPVSPPITTQPPVSNIDLGNIAASLIGLGLSVGAIATAVNYVKNLNDQINNQTKPEAQQANSCAAMNSPSCTKGFEDRIKNPLSDKLDAAQIARDTGQAYEIAQFTAIAENFTKVKTFLDNTIVDRAIGVANFAMNVHNALMLSNALGRTLAGVVDTAMNLTPFRFTDATTGTPTTASRAFSSNVSALIVNLIGQDLYTELSDDWKVANRFYQGTTNLFNRTERLFAGQSKVQQKTGIDVANIGNALRANGIVNPNSYAPMAATKEANTPTELLADVNTPLSSIQSGIRNLNTITKSVSGTVKQISGIQKEFGKLADLTNKESKIRKSLRTQSANQAKVKAKFTLLQIKTIKATGKK